MKKLIKAGCMTDIHFGRKNNSKIHNDDCRNYIEWFLGKCNEHEVDHIVFMGDWFEERDSINSLTTKYAMDCAELLNSLMIPVYFIVGNHDLYYRDNREVYASYIYKSLSNFRIIDGPTVSEDTLAPTLYCPFLFESEYAELSQYFHVPVWMGHFEFKGFVLTGDTMIKESGPDPNNFSAPDHILSGHFHKRQQSKNITYIGNTFPMDYGDVNDNNRGMAIFDYMSSEVQFINWDESPKYMKVLLSEVLENPSMLSSGARVKCIADIDITYNENSMLKQKMIDDHNLREFNIEENMAVTIIADGELTEEEIQAESTSSLVRKLISRIECEGIDNAVLLSEYDTL